LGSLTAGGSWWPATIAGVQSIPNGRNARSRGVLTRTETLGTDWSCAVARVKCPGRKSTGKKGPEMGHRSDGRHTLAGV
jgi:hypothetical protein